VESWQEVLNLRGEGSIYVDVAFSRDGDAFGVGSATGPMHIWRAPSWAEIEKAEARE
jgi:hypothetical protein